MPDPPPSNLRPMRPVKRTPFDEQVLPLRGDAARQTAPPGWNTACVLKILCPKDKDVVAQISRSTLNVADSISFDDPYYNGKKWTIKPFPAGGTSDAGQKKIGILRGASCEEAATTFYHEIVHQNQPQDGSLTFAQMEYEAYAKAEQWTIDRGLPPQDGVGSMRTKDANGKTTVDQKGVEAFVHKVYPVPAKGVTIRPVGRDKRGNTILSDGKKRPPRKGDTYPGPEKVVGEKTIKPADPLITPWHCP